MYKVVIDGRPGLQAHPPKGCNPWNLVIPGGELKSDESVTDFVYQLLPRNTGIEYDFENLPGDPASGEELRRKRMKASHDLIDALEHCSAVAPGIMRGAKKDVCFPDGKAGSKYCCMGKYPYRTGRGVLERDLQALFGQKGGNPIGKLIRRMDHLTKEFTQTRVVAGVEKAKQVLGYEGMSVGEGGKRACIYSSVAFGKNVFLSCHEDEDSYYSLVTVESRGGDSPYGMKDPILVYFCFPLYGVKVGLRRGDILMFNPRVKHCVSSAVDEDTDYFCISMYLKTPVVSGHDNKATLSEEQLAFLGDPPTSKRSKRMAQETSRLRDSSE